MKIHCFIIFFITAFNVNLIAQPNEEQLESFRSAKSVRIIINQSGDVQDANLELKYMAQKIVEYANLSVLPQDTIVSDLTFRINVTGSAISALYIGLGSLYTGASIAGTFSLETKNKQYFEVNFSGRVEPQSAITSATANYFHERSTAPFGGALHKSAFKSKIVDNMKHIFGMNWIITAITDDYGPFGQESVKLLESEEDSFIFKPLAAAISSKDPVVRRNALKILGNCADQRSFELITQKLNDENALVRSTAVEALGKFKNQERIEHLINALKDRDERVRSSAAMHLGNIDNIRVVPPLIEALKDYSPSVRRNAAESLGKLHASEAVTPLIRILNDKYEFVQIIAVESLGMLGDSTAIEPLNQLLNNDKLKGAAKISIKKLTNKDNGSMDFCEALKDEDWNVRKYAAEVLGRLENNKNTKIIGLLIKALDDENKSVSWQAGYSLRLITGEDFDNKEV